MNEAVAKRYVKALVASVDQEKLSEFSKLFTDLSSAFSSERFRDIIFSPEIPTEKREDFLLSIANSDDMKIKNFLKLLVDNNRVADIPVISRLLKSELAKAKNEYEGVLISDFEVSEDQLKDIEEKISKKLSAKIKLKNRVTDYSGVKVEIDDLGVELGLSTDRLKSQLQKHILSAIN